LYATVEIRFEISFCLLSDAVSITGFVAANGRTIGKLGRISEAVVPQMRFYAAIYLGWLRNMTGNLNSELNWTHSEFRPESFP